MKRALLLLGCAAGASQTGCPAPCGDDPPVILATFEGCLDDTCGFAAPAGARVWIEPTVHPGERALFLSGETHAVASIDADIDLVAGGWPQVHLVTSCAGDVRLAVDDDLDDGYRLTVALPPGPSDGRDAVYDDVLAQLPNPGREGPLTVTELRVVNAGGTCAVDDIAILRGGVCE